MKLLNCPSCGGSPETIIGDCCIYIRCSKCGLRTPGFSVKHNGDFACDAWASTDMAIKVWEGNRRDEVD